jgi:hypothetical protein
MINALEFGFKRSEPNFDNTPIWNKLLANSNIDSVFFPQGNYYFLTNPNRIIRHIKISGQSMSNTVLVKKFNSLDHQAFISFGSGLGSCLENMSIIAYNECKNGIALELISSVDGQSPDFCILNNINITGYGGTGQWQIGVSLNGVYRSRQALSGLRDLSITNLYIFACTKISLDINTVHGADITCYCYSAGGTTDLIRFNAWSDDKNNAIFLKSPIPIYHLDVWNSVDCTIIAPRYDKVNKINSKIKIL